MFIENVTYNYLLALDTNVPESYGFQLLVSLRIVVCPRLKIAELLLYCQEL